MNLRPLFCLSVFVAGLGFFALETRAAPRSPQCSLRTLLSPEEFQKAGLEKLSAEELLFLELRLFGAKAEESGKDAGDAARMQDPLVLEAAKAIARLPQGEAAFGREQQLTDEVIRIQKVPNEIITRHAGRFEGWSGGTRFVLENGQEWLQAESGVFVVSLESPVVRIKKGLLGVFYLGVEGYGSRVKVKRVK